MRRTTVVILAVSLALGTTACFRKSKNATATSPNQPTSISMTEGRAFHSAVSVSNGDVYVIGGQNASGAATASIEKYSSGAFSSGGSLLQGRYDFSAVLLSSGSIFIAGGNDGNGNSLSSTEIYDPSTGSVTAGPTLATGRHGHTAFAYTSSSGNEQVAICGGLSNSTGTLTALMDWEIYDPNAGTISAGGNLADYVFYGTALEGAVLGIGSGFSVNSGGTVLAHGLQVFDTTAGTFTAVNFTVNWGNAGVAVTSNGTVYLAGGTDATQSSVNDSIQSYASGSVATLGGVLSKARRLLTATALSNGDVAFVGGSDGNASLDVVEILSGATVTTQANLNEGRYGHTATALSNGDLLVCGGVGSAGVLASAEVLSTTSTGGTAGSGSTSGGGGSTSGGGGSTSGGSGNVIWSEDFEASTPANARASSLSGMTPYDFGAPAGSGPTAAAQGSNVAGTGLSADYDDANYYTVELYNIDLSSATAPTFTAQVYYDIDTSDDYGFLWIESPAGSGTWDILPVSSNSGLQFNANFQGYDGFNGTSGQWVTVEADLSSFVGNNVVLAFDLYGGGTATNAAGIFVDDCQITD